MEHQKPIIIQNIGNDIVLDDLPESVIVEEILVRLPAEDILRCRAVRKSWHHATSTHDFLLEHHHNQPSLPIIDLIKPEGKELDRHLFVFSKPISCAASRKFRQQTILWYPKTFPYEDNLEVHGAFDGLLVVSFCDGKGFLYRERFFDVCNPSTRQRAPLPLLGGYEHCLPVREILIAGFYRHRASEEYRVLYSVWTSRVDFHILAVGSNESRTIKEPPLQQNLLDGLTCSKNAPVPKRGNLHWILEQYYTSYDFSNIIVFDTSVETFRWMSCPPPQYPWMSLLELDGALAICGGHDSIIINIHVMHDYEAEVWALSHRINLLALEASPQLNLLAMTVPKIVTFNERELLIEHTGCVMHCDLDGKFLGKMECDEGKDSCMHITSFRFQENIFPFPFFGMQEDYGASWTLEDEGDDQMQHSIWP